MIEEKVIKESSTADTIRALANVKGCRFISLVYKSKGTGELARHTIALGVNLRRAYSRDVKIVQAMRPETVLAKQARQEVLESMITSLKVGLGNNPNYNNQGLYVNLFDGVKVNRKTGQVLCYGFTIKKEVLQAGEHKEVKSKPLTIEKNKIRKHLKHTRHRDFLLDHVNRVSVNGNVLEIV